MDYRASHLDARNKEEIKKNSGGNDRAFIRSLLRPLLYTEKKLNPIPINTSIKCKCKVVCFFIKGFYC